MPSNINPYNVDGTFPVANQNNDSQGFRDNFRNIKSNLIFAQNEITDLQAKAIVSSALDGQVLVNDMGGTQIRRPQLAAWTQSLLDLGAVSETATLDFNQANFQKITTAAPITLAFVNWPASTGQGAVGYGLMRVWIVVTNISHTVTFPESVTIGESDLAGYNADTRTITFDTPGNYVFDFSSTDSGSNFLVFDNTRNRVQFRDPSFYFNEDVSPTFLIGFQDALPLAISLATGNDTLELNGSQTNYGGVLEHGNEVGLGINSYTQPELGGNANVAGYSVATSRAYINPETGEPVFDATALVQSNDYIGYIDFLGASLNPLNPTDVSINEFSVLRGFVTGSNPYSPGGNLWIGTKADGGLLTKAITIENDQSVVTYGNLITANTFVPSGPTDVGTKGQISYDADYIYICLDSGNWKRASLGW